MDNLAVMLIDVIIGLLFIGIGVPLAQNKIKRNYSYGYRIFYTLVDDDIWYAVNAKGGKHFIISGVILMIIGIFSVFFMADDRMQGILLKLTVAVILMSIAITTISGYILARKMAKKKKIVIG